jgi:NADH/NAD ratio-sensing transcriptional regulator Rex
VAEDVHDVQVVVTNFTPARLAAPARVGVESVDDESIIAFATS